MLDPSNRFRFSFGGGAKCLNQLEHLRFVVTSYWLSRFLLRQLSNKVGRKTYASTQVPEALCTIQPTYIIEF